MQNINNRLSIDKEINKSIDNRLGTKQVNDNNRVEYLHSKLIVTLKDDNYGIGHTYKIAKKMSDNEILTLADYCNRKAFKPVAAFISICERKMV